MKDEIHDLRLHYCAFAHDELLAKATEPWHWQVQWYTPGIDHDHHDII